MNPSNKIVIKFLINFKKFYYNNGIIQEGRKLYKDYNTQLIVVTVDFLDGHDIKQYSNDLFRKWGIGDKRENSGILLLISKKDRKARIKVGYGMEGIIPDGKAGRILNSMFAEFKKRKL